MNNSLEKLLTVEEVMTLLRISRPTLYRLLKSKALGPVRIGKRTLFDPADIRAFVEGSKQEAVPKTSQQKEKKQPRENLKPPKPKRTKGGPEKPGEKPLEPERPKRTRVKSGKPHEIAPKPEKPKRAKSKKPDDTDKQGRLL
jgi:excisionase family DNA binding protein